MSQAESKYIRATTSSHLQATEFAGSVDALIAAGWIKEGLITLLWRARNEFDCLNRHNSDDPTTAMLMAMMQMKTLPEAKRAMGAFVLGQWALMTWPEPKPGKEYEGVSRERAFELSARCLQSFIAPQCQECRGLGFSGGYRSQRIQCRACRESGRVLRPFGDLKADIDFGQAIMSRLEEKTDALARRVRVLTKQRGPIERAKRAVSEAQSA